MVPVSPILHLVACCSRLPFGLLLAVVDLCHLWLRREPDVTAVFVAVFSYTSTAPLALFRDNFDVFIHKSYFDANTLS